MSDYRINIIVEGRDNASGALNGVHGALGRIAEFALGGLVASGLAAIGRGIGDIAREAFGGATGLQNLTLSLETLAARELVAAGGAENIEDALGKVGPVAEGLLGRLKDLALVSPFEFEQVADAFRLQMAFGATGDSAIDLTKAVLDTGAGLGMTNESMGRMTYNLAQALQAGDLTAANMRQLKMVGLDLGDVFQDELGMSIEDVREGLKDGALTMADVSGAFVRYADVNFGGASERMSKTFQGLQSSFKDLMYFGGADLLTPALEVVTGALGGVFDTLRGMLESGKIAEIGEQLGGFVERVLGFIERIGEGGIGALVPPEVVANVDAFLAGLEPVGRVISEVIWPAIVEFLPTLQLWGEQLLILASSALPLLADALQFVVDNWEIFAIIGGVVAAVILAIEAPLVLVIAALAALYLAWVNDWGGIRTFIEGVVAGIAGVIQGGLAVWQGFWDKHGATITAITQGAWGVIQAGIETVSAVISGIIAAFASAFEGDWRGFGENLRVAWDAVWNGIAEILRRAWDTLSGIVANLISAIVNKFTSTDWGALGRGIIQGIIDGINAALSWLIEACRAAASAAWEVIKGFFGIGSPSLLMRGLGENMMRGWAEGVKASVGLPLEALAAAVAGAQAGMGELGGGMGGWGGGGEGGGWWWWRRL